MGLIRAGVPTELAIALKDAYNLQGFIETGTNYGGTALWAAQYFQKVITIEAAKAIHEAVVKNYGHLKNIEFVLGNSKEQLEAIVPTLKEPCIFWLDAHWSGGVTYGEADECPLLEELQIINDSEFDHFILIDDARLFLCPPPRPHRIEEWPTIDAVTSLLNSGKSRYTVIVEDVIVSVPEKAKLVVAQYSQAVSTKAWEDEVRSLHQPAPALPEKQAKSRPAAKTTLHSGELLCIERFIASGQVVFDVGANVGSWSEEVFNQFPDTEIHLFEPVPKIYKSLLQNLADGIGDSQIIPNNYAAGKQEESKQFAYYQDSPEWSTFHRRLQAEKEYGIKEPQIINVLTTTIDNYCRRQEINRINFLKIDVEGGELNVLEGANNLLCQGKIDYIQFEYGGTYIDSKTTLQQVFEYFQNLRYAIFKILPDGLEYLPTFQPDYENYQWSIFLAVNERFRSTVLGEAPQMLDLQQLCMQHSIVPRGVVHVGAHEGHETGLYQAMGVERVLYIEANPEVFARLQLRIAEFRNVQAVNCAASDRNGTVNLHVTSMDQSSSILPLKRHAEIYPTIQETHQVTVESKTLDTLLQELELEPADFNIINLDIQGAELLALQGATNLLKYIEAINTEVNYEELYEGCALIDQLDEFLDNYGFDRAATTTPLHPSWGDAFYVKKPAVTISSLDINRFGNQIFEYAFIRIYAKQHNLRYETPTWIGQYLFGHQDPPISQKLPEVREVRAQDGTFSVWFAEALIPNSPTIYKNVDFSGYCQYHTKYYAPYKDYVRSLFKPETEVETKMQGAIACLRSIGKTVVGLHLRRGDYSQFNTVPFLPAPSEWYKEWLRGLWERLDEPVLFIASDEIEKVIEDFAEYSPVTAKDLGADLDEAEFYPDFYILSQCDVVAISNSSFSFAACMLSETGKFFFRPDWSAQKLIPFDPWNSEPLLWENPKKLNSDAIPEQFKLSDVELLLTNYHLSDEEFVQAAYRKYLLRYPDEAGKQWYIKLLGDKRITRRTILAGMRQSIEFQYVWEPIASASEEEIYWHLAAQWAKQGKWEEAIAIYHQAIRSKSDLVLAYSRWADDLAAQNQPDAQVALKATFFKALLNQPDSAEFYACLGKLLAARGKAGEAIQAYQKSLLIQSDSPDSGQIYFELGKAQAQQNQLNEAISSYHKAIGHHPEWVQVYFYIGQALAQQNKLDEAISSYQKVIQQYPEWAEVYLCMGQAKSHQNKFDEAIEFYQKSIQIYPQYIGAYLLLGGLLHGKSKFDEAISCFQDLINLEHHRFGSIAQTYIGSILQQQGKQEEANLYFQKAQPVAPPQGCYSTVREWSIASQLKQTNYIELHSRHRFSLCAPPQTIDRAFYPILNSWWSQFESPATFVVTIPEGRYCEYGYNTETAVITSDNQLLLDVSTCPGIPIDRHPIFSATNLPLVQHIEGTVAVLSVDTGLIYYHWMLDLLPRIGLLQQSGIDLGSIDKFLINGYSSPFQKETLEVLGIRANQIIETKNHAHIKANKLVVPSYPGFQCFPTKSACDFLRSNFLPLALKSKSRQLKRIYISRNAGAQRRTINEDEVLNILNERGFTRIFAESISFAEQVALMANAEVVVLMHGSAVSNLVFCQPGTKVIEIFSPHHVVQIGELISHYQGLDYYYLIGSGIECPQLRQLVYDRDGYEDTLVNIDSLKNLLEQAGVA
ncbi:FkbM family methyltransferase [Microcoleus sp. herbarium14]|uniref:FkbM family methyltransferase n=1 Tax=Microcoleus sp. herbarium14 TaxID=3055439 RepID=UPI002FD22A16